MAAPTVSSRGGTVNGTDSTSHAITLPAGLATGDEIVVVFSADGSPTCTPDSGSKTRGWRKVGQASNTTVVTGAVFAKARSNGDDALTVTTSASEQSSHVSLAIPAGGAITSISANGSSTNSNPASLTDVSEDHLWIATRSGDAAVQATVVPSGYSTLTTQTGGTTGASTATAEKTSTASTTEDPGTFTSATEQWVSWTIGIAPRRGGTPLGTWNTARAGAASTRAKWLAIGDSVTEGHGATTRASRYAEQALATLRTRAGVSGGGRTYNVRYNVFNESVAWASDSVSGNGTSQTLGPFGSRAVSLDAGQSITWTVSGSSAEIWFAQYSGAGSFTWAVDGGGTTSVNANNATSAYVPTTISLGSNGSHTVAVAFASGATAYIAGLQVIDGAGGVALYEAGLAGVDTAGYIGGQGDYQYTPASWDVMDPHLVTVELGLNDAFLDSADPRVMVRNLRTLIRDIRTVSTSPSVAIIAAYTPAAGVLASATPWAEYADALRLLAEADGMLALVDLDANMPAATTSGTGNYVTDGLHPNNTGHALIGSLIADVVSPLTSPPPDPRIRRLLPLLVR